MSEYLKGLERAEIKPNFWCSEEYFKKALFREEEVFHLKGKKEIILVVDSGDNVIFPPLNLTDGGLYPLVPKNGIWADLVGFSPKKSASPKFQMEFLDYNYIYDPKEFEEMKGNRWATFRKNSRKFPRRHVERKFFWLHQAPEDDIKEFAGKVLENVSSDVIHDAQVILQYLFEGENRAFLVHEESREILAVNIWDENYRYVNYRYAFCVDEPFLSEYIRLCFYQMMNKKYPGKWVNDGGVLDRPSLKQFKDKLNPVEVNKIYSWKCDGEEED